jgi:hypothetical protein
VLMAAVVDRRNGFLVYLCDFRVANAARSPV